MNINLYGAKLKKHVNLLRRTNFFFFYTWKRKAKEKEKGTQLRILITLITFAKQTELRGRTNDLELETITERGAILGKLVHTLVALQCKYA